MVKFSLRSYQFFQRCEPNCGKNDLSHNVEESFKKFLNLYPDEGDSRNLIGSSSSKDISLVKDA